MRLLISASMQPKNESRIPELQTRTQQQKGITIRKDHLPDESVPPSAQLELHVRLRPDRMGAQQDTS